MNDILACCRLPACDQLVIVDCCYAAKAFGPYHIGKRKFEMIVSSGCENRVPAPHQPGSFTKSLNQALKRLLEENKSGFVTSQLYREIYHSIVSEVKPWLFDQGRRDYGRILLRPQPPKTSNDMESPKGGAYLNLTLKLNEKPDNITMNELALSLQYLPNIEHVRFEKLYAPRKQIEEFMYFVRLAAKLRPLIRQIHARRRKRQLAALPQHESYKRLYLDQKNTSPFDWSSALDDHNPSPTSPSLSRRKKSNTWPPVEAESLGKGKSLTNRFFSIDYRFGIPSSLPIPGFSQLRRAETFATGTFNTNGEISSKRQYLDYWEKPSACSDVQYAFSTGRSWKTYLGGDELSHAFMWSVLCYTLVCFCYYMKE